MPLGAPRGMRYDAAMGDLVDRDLVGGLLFAAFGLAVMVWGARTLRGPRQRAGLFGAGAALWSRALGAALVLIGAVALLGGVYLLLDLRNL